MSVLYCLVCLYVPLCLVWLILTCRLILISIQMFCILFLCDCLIFSSLSHYRLLGNICLIFFFSFVFMHRLSHSVFVSCSFIILIISCLHFHTNLFICSSVSLMSIFLLDSFWVVRLILSALFVLTVSLCPVIKFCLDYLPPPCLFNFFLNVSLFLVCLIVSCLSYVVLSSSLHCRWYSVITSHQIVLYCHVCVILSELSHFVHSHNFILKLFLLVSLIVFIQSHSVLSLSYLFIFIWIVFWFCSDCLILSSLSYYNSCYTIYVQFDLFCLSHSVFFFVLIVSLCPVCLILSFLSHTISAELLCLVFLIQSCLSHFVLDASLDVLILL